MAMQLCGEEGATVTGEECQFCHTQGAPEPVETEIKEKGYFIQKIIVSECNSSPVNSETIWFNLEEPCVLYFAFMLCSANAFAA